MAPPRAGRPDDQRPDGRWPDHRQSAGRWPDDGWPDERTATGGWSGEQESGWPDERVGAGGWPEPVDPWADEDVAPALARRRSGRRRAGGAPAGAARHAEPTEAFAGPPTEAFAGPGHPAGALRAPGQATAEQPAVGQQPGIGRHGAGRRLGPIGIGAIVAAVLVAFGLGAVALSPLFSEPHPDAAPPPGFLATSYSEEPATPSEEPSPSPSRAGTGTAALEGAVVALVNAQRARAHCAPVHVDERLQSAARAHSVDMAAHSFLSHTGSDRSSPEERMRRYGYPAPLGETIASRQRTANDVVSAWMRAKGQRAVMLDCAAKAVGVGLAYRKDGTPYWTQDFGRE